MMRSLSSVITFHNAENRPGNQGFCVANHTTPMDVAMLSTDHTYAMVRMQERCANLLFMARNP